MSDSSRFLGPAQFKTEGTPVGFENDVPVPVGYLAPTWRDMLEEEMSEHGEGVFDLTSPIAGQGLDWVPDYGDGGWTAWSPKRVYFPTVYDGSFSVASVPREPCPVITKPIGGGG